MTAPSPLQNADEPVHVSLAVGGQDLGPASLLSVTVRRALNQIPSATLVFEDGDLESGRFPLSDSAQLVPGAEITVRAGYGGDRGLIFAGIVVKQGLAITGDNASRLIVECRDKAVRMTVGRRNAVYEEQTDSGIARALVEAHGLDARVPESTVVHPSLVQHHCTDWDFMLARAEASGRVVVVDEGAVMVAAPETSGDPVLAVTWGDSLIEFEAELDASQQYTEVRAQAWDAGQQAVLQSSPAGPAALNSQGNLGSKKLAAVMSPPQVLLQTGAALSKDALDGWARAQQLRSGLARLRGRMRFQGSALARVGALIELSGVGERFSGSAYVTALTHRISDGNWTTEAEFGTPTGWLAERPGAVAPLAAGGVSGIEGMHIGIVRKLDGDPAGAHRVQLELPTAQVPAIWARLAQGYASNGFGALFMPEIGDEVLVGFLANDPGCPVVLGSLYSRQRPPPVAPAAGNDVKALVTRSRARLEFHDGDKVITVSTPGGNQVVLSDKGEAITLTDQHHNQVRLDAGGITIDSAADVRITAQGAITVAAVGALSLGSKSDTVVQGLNVTCEAQVAVTARGTATAELSASGQTTVKGAMVMIN